MTAGLSSFLAPLLSKSPMLLAVLNHERGTYWLLLLALLSLIIVLLVKKRKIRSIPTKIDKILVAWKLTNSSLQTTAEEKAEVAEAVSAHWQDLDKQVLQLKTQVEAKNKVLDHLMQHLLPQALSIEKLKTPAQELFNLVKSVQLSAHFSDHELAAVPTDFEQKLLLKHPELTEEELRLCAYLFLHLNSQQIANLKAISVAGVNKARARLRKKLGLQSEIDLSSYLNQMQQVVGQ
jgi:DNA-binding CsgD family transcriptional regulator